MARRAGTVRIGISGWRYAGWRGVFYPPGLPQRQELAYASRRLDTIEINGSFYSLQRPSSYGRWRDETPDGFVFAVKGGRFVTHNKKLRDCEGPLANFFASGPLALGAKLGPILWQLPPQLAFDVGRLRDFFALLPRTTRACGTAPTPRRTSTGRSATRSRCGIRRSTTPPSSACFARRASPSASPTAPGAGPTSRR